MRKFRAKKAPEKKEKTRVYYIGKYPERSGSNIVLYRGRILKIDGENALCEFVDQDITRDKKIFQATVFLEKLKVDTNKDLFDEYIYNEKIP